MRRSLEMQAKAYPSLGECIFCGCKSDLTREHIVPEALTGIGQIYIENGSCKSCNAYANTQYERPSFDADFLPIRHVLGLRRKRRGKKQKPRRMPLVSYTASADDAGSEGFDEELPPEHYPSVCSFVVHPPAGILSGLDRSGPFNSLKLMFMELGLKNRSEPYSVTSREPRLIGGPEMVVAKMAYCWAVAEKGLEALDTSDLRNLLRGDRTDVFNFVGSPLVPESLPMLRLHKFYFRQRGELTTVLVHLFASFGGPVYEVVIGRSLA